MRNIKKINVGFCKIFYENDRDINRLLVNSIKKAYNANLKFFNYSGIKKFKIILVNSRKDMNLLWGHKTANDVSGFSRNNRIILFSPNAIEKETCWKKSDFYSTLIHEINHLFFTNIAKTHKPLWLCEGVASYIQPRKKRTKGFQIPYSILKSNFNNCGVLRYDCSRILIRHLIKNYKKEKLLVLIRSLKNRNKNINETINAIYKKNLRAIIKDANSAQRNF